MNEILYSINEDSNELITQETYKTTIQSQQQFLLNNLNKEFLENFENDDNAINEVLNDNVDIEDDIETIRQTVEKNLSIFEDKKSILILSESSLITLHEKEYNIRKNLDSEWFFNSKLLESSCLIKNTNIENLFFPTQTEFVLFLSVVRDKVYEAYNEFIKSIIPNIDFAHNLINGKVDFIEDKIITPEEVKDIHKKYSKSLAPLFISYARDIPGFDSFCQHDFLAIIQDNMSVLFGFRITKLFINDECYLLSDKILFNKMRLKQFFGEDVCSYLFEFHKNLNSLSLTNKEFALLIPFVLTSLGI